VARIKVSSAKAKGRNLQKWTCEKVAKVLDLPYGYEDDRLIQPRLMGQSGTDVVLRGEAREHFPFDIECKATEKINLYADIEQAKKNTLNDRIWLLVHKKSRQDPIVVMDANFFFLLIEKILEHGQI
jgi:hypothetical protein